MPLRPCQLSHLVFDEREDLQTVHLVECTGARRRLPIKIGPSEAQAIDRAIKGARFPRPLTHDLICGLIQATQHRLAEVRIIDLKEQTFFAQLALDGPDAARREIDCRPSDAIALLVRHPGVPLLVEEAVLAEAAAG
jgi:bifunctional DNase/RNase